ncbi:MAG: hypothetical protein CVT64_09090 [Actinobacteria bacterium HGW-Actinobacteria-4]|nr:MAG: hypothetical protein CVT64_09090 [Actinobacteria bacterium HGW-Actinobacteria-4]
MALSIGDRVAVYGGEYSVAWLGARPHLTGTVRAWNPGRHDQLACVVELDDPFTTQGEVDGKQTAVSGTFLVLHLRHRRDSWAQNGMVHVELFARQPDAEPWAERAWGAWVELKATYANITSGDGAPVPPNPSFF